MDIEELEEKIIYHKNLYYQGKPEISDEEFDGLEELLRKKNPNSYVLNIVGSNIFSSEKVKHSKKMLSLGKTYSVSELLKWKKDHDLVSTFKIDGSSCSIIYKDGFINIGKTRGNGTFGENITDKLLFISSIPKVIDFKGQIEVRGEIFCREKNFKELKIIMEKRGLNLPTSQRNIVAGILGRKENIDLAGNLSFQSFEVLSEDKSFSTEIEKFKFLESNGFETPKYSQVKNEEEINREIKDTEVFMAKGDYLIDGIVFTYNDVKLHEELGETAHHPRYKMAYKFQGDTAVSAIKTISWQVSRNGILTPVANIESVELSGANVSRVTLHNWGNVKENKLKSGDIIKITRSGEVIPKFLEVITSSKKDFLKPKNCPSCKKEIREEEIRLICDNSSCPEKVLDEIDNFIKKIGIEDLSKKRIYQFVEAGLITGIESLYTLKKDDLLELDKVQEKLATKLINSIESSKSVDLKTFLSSLGLTGGAYNKCEKIVDAGFNTIDKVLSMKAEDLMQVDSFAEKSANDIVVSLREKRKLIDFLLKNGFDPKSNSVTVNSKLKNLKFCITGTLSMKRSELERIVKNNGGEVQSGVNNKTNYLITNDTESSSSKFKKAQNLDIPIINEDKLMEMINGKN